MLKKWIAKKKAQWLFKWAEESGLHVVQIKASAGTEYLVDKHGAWRKLAKIKVTPNKQVEGAEGCLQPKAPARTGG